MAGGNDLGKFILRLVVGGLMLLHGIHKIQNGLGFVEGALDGKGLPTFLAYGVYVGEVVAPILLIVGFQTRLAALALAGTMGMAIFLVHLDDLTRLQGSGAWGAETPAFFLLAALSIFLMGPGKMSIDGRKSAG